MSLKKQILFYFSKVSIGCLAAYLSILSLPFIVPGAAPETEQIVSILAAIMGSDFICLVTKRLFGELFHHGKGKGE